MGQLHTAQMGRYGLDASEFGSIGRKSDEADVAGDAQIVADMPAGSVQDGGRMGSWRHGPADRDQMRVHGSGEAMPAAGPASPTSAAFSTPGDVAAAPCTSTA